MDNYLLNVPGNGSSVFIVGFKKVKIDTLFTGFLYLNVEHGPKSTDFLFRNEIYPIRTQSQRNKNFSFVLLRGENTKNFD